MSLQLVIGRADVPRAGRAAERDVERDTEQGKASPGREQRWGRTGGASLSSWQDLGSGYGIMSFRDLLYRAGDGAGRFGKRSGSCRRETSGCL